MTLLPRFLAVGWGILVMGSLFLTYMMPPGAKGVWERIELFATWQGLALLVALIAMGLSLARRDVRGGQLWWFGWGPLIGSAFIAAFVGLAVVTARFL